jgi:pyruvate,water dikinase
VILDWAETFRAGPARCGGKGFNLARLHRYGFPVPRGGVLPADVYSDFIRAFSLEPFASITATRALGAATELSFLRAEIEKARLPDGVRTAIREFLPGATIAVRSSAAAEDGAKASFAGIHRSFLDVRDPDARERAVLGCFASLWTPQALAYRRAQGIPDRDVPCAVVFCEMVPAAVAGVAFSCDPRTGRRDLVVINAAPGPGERVVSGAVTPDHIEVRLARGRAETLKRSGTALTPEQEIELARAVERIHWDLGDGENPQDVEWAHDGRRFWFLQSRPATRVPRLTYEPARTMPVYWSTANIKDAVPGVVSILAWSLIHEAIDDLLYAAPKAAGYPILDGVQIVKRFDGRAYFDLTTIQWCLYDFAGLMPERVAASIGGHQPVIPVPPGDPLDGPEGKRRRGAMRKVAWRMLKLPRALKRASAAQFRAVREILDAQPRTKEAIRAAFERLARLHETLDPLVGLANGYGDGMRDMVRERLQPAAGPRTEPLLSRLSSGSGGASSAEHGWRIDDLAAIARRHPDSLKDWKSVPEFRREFERYLADFGHRAVYEADLLNPRWGDDPAYILDQVRAHLDLEPVRRDAGRRIRDEAWREVKRIVPFWKRPVLAWLLRRMRWGYAARENAKSAMAASMWPARRLALECGRLMGLPRPELAFHLSKADLMSYLAGSWDGAGAAELALDREARREEWLKRPEPPDVVIEGGAPVRPAAAAPASDGSSWSGIAASAGRAQGKARVVRHPADGARLRRGEVLVAPSTDPGWTPLFLRAGAIVMETGGYLSHGAIVAREFGLPAVVNIPGLLGQVKDGETLIVDGDQGTVNRERSPHDQGE